MVGRLCVCLSQVLLGIENDWRLQSLWQHQQVCPAMHLQRPRRQNIHSGRNKFDRTMEGKEIKQRL